MREAVRELQRTAGARGDDARFGTVCVARRAARACTGALGLGKERAHTGHVQCNFADAMNPFSVSPLSIETLPRIALVVEDDPSTRQLIMRALSQIHCVAHGFGNGEAALAWVEMNPAPDIVSLDLVLPWIGGIRVCESLRRNEKTKHVPIVVLTGRTEVQDEAAALEAGADAFIEKPFRLKNYLDEIKRLMSCGHEAYEPMVATI